MPFSKLSPGAPMSSVEVVKQIAKLVLPGPGLGHRQVECWITLGALIDSLDDGGYLPLVDERFKNAFSAMSPAGGYAAACAARMDAAVRKFGELNATPHGELRAAKARTVIFESLVATMLAMHEAFVQHEDHSVREVCAEIHKRLDARMDEAITIAERAQFEIIREETILAGATLEEAESIITSSRAEVREAIDLAFERRRRAETPAREQRVEMRAQPGQPLFFQRPPTTKN